MNLAVLGLSALSLLATDVKETRAVFSENPVVVSEKGPKHKTPDEIVNEIDAVVQLSPEQKTKVKSLAEVKVQKMKALHAEAKASADKEALKTQRMEIRKEFRNGLNQILNEEQKAKLKAHRQEKMKEHKSHKGQGHSPESAVKKMDEIVGLREDQKAKMLTLVTEKQAQMKTLKTEVEKGTLTETAAKTRREEIQKTYRKNVHALLDDAQKAKLKAHKESRKEEMKK